MQSCEIYQFRIWIKKISPMIWRRFLMRSDHTIEDLHYCIQIIMGWENDHLHQFTIHGKDYGIGYIGGVCFDENASNVFLRDFKFRFKEKFTYEYNFFSHWVHEIRLEKKLPFVSSKHYPFCLEGRRRTPPEYCKGPWDFMKEAEHNDSFKIEMDLIEMIRNYKKDDSQEEILNRLKDYQIWQDQNKFDRSAVNKKLQKYFLKDGHFQLIDEEEQFL